MQKRFFINFFVSLIGYIVINYIGRLTNNINIMIFDNTPMPVYILATYWLLTFVTPIVLYFYFGRKLNILSNPTLNYLSISSSFIFALVAIHIPFDVQFNNEMMSFFGSFPYAWMGILLVGTMLFGVEASEFFITIYPSVIMWFGLTCKNRNLKTKRQSNTVNSGAI